MKKMLIAFAALCAFESLFAASYKNNTYQKLAEQYTKKAEAAMYAGEYALAEEYAAKAEENAALSEAFIKKMLAKADCDVVMKQASQRLDYAKSIEADRNFPMAYTAAQQTFANAQEAYNAEDYATAASYAKQVMEALADVREIIPLPEYYVVRPWADTKDCYWNISGRPYIYNNPLLWENLYQDAENKANMPKPSDPNLILPGMKMKIPSITGEYRRGVYTPSKQYEPYTLNR